MKEIVEKLRKVKDEILLEKTTSKLRIFVLIARADLEGKWDIILSADWLERTNSEKDLVYLITKLKSEFGENLDFLARIVVATPREIFIQHLGKAIINEPQGELGELKDLQISADFKAQHLFVIEVDFDGINLEKMEGTEEGPLAFKDSGSF